MHLPAWGYSHRQRRSGDSNCPVTGNPQPGSTLTIAYKGATGFLEVAALRSFIDSYIGGRGDVRSMEGMLQQICQACADALSADVKLTSHSLIQPSQIRRVTCYAFPVQK
jgi:NADPH-dependent 7-cyano-7-deazaguanine reductase QueF